MANTTETAQAERPVTIQLLQPDAVLPAGAGRPPRITSREEREEALSAFSTGLAASPDFDELQSDLEEAVRGRHAPSTRANYDYWLGRLERWLTDPATRFRFRELAPMPLEALWPIDHQCEVIIASFLRDITKGPKDPDELERWLEASGPMSPSTLDLVIAAIRARASDHQPLRWIPSTWMDNVLRGLRRELREHYGSDRQATPLLGRAHVAPMAQFLLGRPTPQVARDRLLLELHVAGVKLGVIGRLRLSALRDPFAGLAATTASANEQLYSRTGEVGMRSLVVPGQRRRGGQADPDTVISLPEHPHLEAALRDYLELECDSGSPNDHDAPLVDLTASNPHSQIKSVLGRLARRTAGVAWRPERGARPTSAEVILMRRSLEQGAGWTGHLRRRRDHAMLLIGYLGALRRHELCDLEIRHIEFQHGKAIVTVRKSKGDQDAKGFRFSLRSVEGAPAALDAVRALRSWIALLRDEYGFRGDDPLFPALSGRNRLHRTTNGNPVRLDPQAWSDRLRELALESRVFGDDEQRYANVTGHSLRRGFVTAAILAGQDPVTIAKQTRHKDIKMIARYAEELELLNGTDWARVHFGESPMIGGEAGEVELDGAQCRAM